MDQPLEVPELRRKVREILNEEKGFPQLLIRMGYGQSIKPTPRREVDEVIL